MIEPLATVDWCACRYEGTVECMTREEWTVQAKSLWADLIDERGRLKICRDVERRLNTSSIEGAAQATLETVYGPSNLRSVLNAKITKAELPA